MLRLFLISALLVFGLAVLSAPSASAASATLTMEPSSVNASVDQEFTVTLKVSSDVDLGAVQTNVIFDRQIVQILDVAPAGPWATALFIVGQAPQTEEQALAQANNETGKLLGVASFFSSGAGSVPAGTSDFLSVRVKAVGGGTSQVTFTPEPLFLVRALDTSQNVVPLETTGGSVNVSGPTLSPTPGGQSPTPSPSPTPAVPTPTPTPGLPIQASLSISPVTLAVRPGTEFSVSLMQTANIETSGALASLGYDQSLLELVSVSRGTGYKNGTVVYGRVPVGSTPPPIAAKIATANATGKLEAITVFLSPPNKAAAGSLEVAVIKFKSRSALGTTALTLSDAEVINTEGKNVGVTAAAGQIQVSTSAAVLPATGGAPGADRGMGSALILVGLLAVLTSVAAVLFARRRTR